ADLVVATDDAGQAVARAVEGLGVVRLGVERGDTVEHVQHGTGDLQVLGQLVRAEQVERGERRHAADRVEVVTGVVVRQAGRVFTRLDHPDAGHVVDPARDGQRTSGGGHVDRTTAARHAGRARKRGRAVRAHVVQGR